MTAQHPHAAVIDRLGGTNKVASLCHVKPPSVSAWRIYGIPDARVQYLELAYPWAFVEPGQAGDAQAHGEGAKQCLGSSNADDFRNAVQAAAGGIAQTPIE